MANFELGRTIETVENHVQVTPTPGTPLRPGRHVFQLVVVDKSGNRSQPATVEVIIRDTVLPTAVIRLIGEPPRFGDAFELSAEGSEDPEGGTIETFEWTLIEAPPPPEP